MGSYREDMLDRHRDVREVGRMEEERLCQVAALPETCSCDRPSIRETRAVMKNE